MKKKFFLALLCCVLCFAMILPALAAPEKPIVSVGGGIVANLDTGDILWGENADKQLYPASLTKIMTALLVIEHGGLEDVITLQESTFDDLSDAGSTAGLKPGEQVSVRQLLYCLLIPSSNEAANALAQHVSGDTAAFIQLMNERAAQLGCQNTHFANTTGLHDEQHYTSAHDMLIITREALKHPLFAQITASKEFTLPPTNLHDKERKFLTTNYLLSRARYPDYIYAPATGVKTGHTTPAGYCLVATASKNNVNLISVVLNAKDETGKIGSFTQTTVLLNHIFDNYKPLLLTQQGNPVHTLPLKLASDIDSLTLVAKEDLAPLLPTDTAQENIKITLDLPDFLRAPIEKGEVIGTATYTVDRQDYGPIELISPTAVKRNFILYCLDGIARFFSNIIVLSIFGCLLLAIATYVAITITTNKKKRYSGGRRRRSY